MIVTYYYGNNCAYFNQRRFYFEFFTIRTKNYLIMMKCDFITVEV